MQQTSMSESTSIPAVVYMSRTAREGPEINFHDTSQNAVLVPHDVPPASAPQHDITRHRMAASDVRVFEPGSVVVPGERVLSGAPQHGIAPRRMAASDVRIFEPGSVVVPGERVLSPTPGPLTSVRVSFIAFIFTKLNSCIDTKSIVLTCFSRASRFQGNQPIQDVESGRCQGTSDKGQ